MVVLEGHNMMGVNSQYLQPDYMSPLTIDSKSSPLALLAKTCREIGVESNNKSILHPSPLSSADSNSSLSSSGSSGAGQKRKASTSSDSGTSSRPRSSGSTSSNYSSSAKQPRLIHNTSPTGKTSPKNYHHNNNNNNNIESSAMAASVIGHNHASKLRKLSGQSISSEASEKSRHGHVPSRNSPGNGNSASSVIVPQGKHSSGSATSVGSPPSNARENLSLSPSSSKSSSPKPPKTNSPKPPKTNSPKPPNQDPIIRIRAGHDVLTGNDLTKFGLGTYGFDPNNPFRLPFLTSAHHAHLLGYQPRSPYSMTPFCNCTGCGAQPRNSFMAAVAAGCAQCPLIPPSAATGPYSSIPGFPPGLGHDHAAAMMQQQAAAIAQQQQQQQQNAQRPYICNWIVGDSYCGKKFETSEILLQHLRSHTNSSGNSSSSAADSAALSTMAQQQPHQLALQHQFLNPTIMRNYPTPPLNHPYAAAFYGKGLGSPQIPMPSAAALSNYYSAIYGQRVYHP